MSATPFRVPWREQAFLTAAGLRGAVPIVLATIALAAGTAGSVEVFDATFLLVIVLTAVQAPPLPWLARALGVTGPSEPTELEVESAPLDQMNAALLEVDVPVGSRLVGLVRPAGPAAPGRGCGQPGGAGRRHDGPRPAHQDPGR